SEAAALLQQRVDRASDQLAASAAAALEADSLHMDAGHALGEGGMRLYRAGSVAAWTDHAPITDAVLDTLRAGHITLPDGSYLHAWAEQGDRSVHALRRIWFKPPFENQYLHRQFDAGFALEQGIVAELEPGLGPVVRDAHGRVMMHLTWADELPPRGGRSLLALLLAGAAIALAIAALWRAAAAGGAGWGPALAFTG